MRGVGAGTAARAVGELPRDEQAAFPTHLHAIEALIPAGNKPAKSLWKRDRLRIAFLWLSIGAENGLAVLVEHRLARMVVGRVELVPVGREPARVLHFVHLARLGVCAGADFEVLIAEREGRLH